MSDHAEFGLSSRETSPNREAANKHSKGGRRYSERIARDSTSGKNLPFQFSKPDKHEKTPVVCQCPECEHIVSVTKNTVMIVCSGCKKLYSVSEEVIIRS